MPRHISVCTQTIHVIIAVCIFSLKVFAGSEVAEFDLVEPGTLELRAMKQMVLEENEPARKWFVLVGIVNVYPRLEREKLIQNILDPVIRTIAPGYQGTATFSDLRDNGLLWTPQIAVGRILSRHFALSIHGGYGAGPVHSKKKNPSVLLGIPFYSNVKIKRRAAYVGLDLDYYPWGMVEQKKYATWLERLRASRPTLGVRYTWTWAGYDARIRLGPWPIKKLVNIRLGDNWALPNITLVAGVDIPVNQRNVIVVNGGYSFFWKEKEDFAGPAFTLGWRYMF